MINKKMTTLNNVAFLSFNKNAKKTGNINTKFPPKIIASLNPNFKTQCIKTSIPKQSVNDLTIDFE